MLILGPSSASVRGGVASGDSTGESLTAITEFRAPQTENETPRRQKRESRWLIDELPLLLASEKHFSICKSPFGTTVPLAPFPLAQAWIRIFWPIDEDALLLLK
jgi:hypothetical protein